MRLGKAMLVPAGAASGKGAAAFTARPPGPGTTGFRRG